MLTLTGILIKLLNNVKIFQSEKSDVLFFKTDPPVKHAVLANYATWNDYVFVW